MQPRSYDNTIAADASISYSPRDAPSRRGKEKAADRIGQYHYSRASGGTAGWITHSSDAAAMHTGIDQQRRHAWPVARHSHQSHNMQEGLHCWRHQPPASPGDSTIGYSLSRCYGGRVNSHGECKLCQVGFPSKFLSIGCCSFVGCLQSRRLQPVTRAVEPPSVLA